MSQKPYARDVLELRASAVEQSPLATAMVDGESQLIVYANAAFCGLVNRSIENVLGHSVAEVLRQDDASNLVALLRRVQDTGEVEYAADMGPDWHRKDTRFAATVWPILDYGRPAGVVLQLGNTFVSAQQRADDLRTANQQLLLAGLDAQERANEARRDLSMQRELARQHEDFLAEVSHDLRTPLTTVKGFTQLLLRRMKDGAIVDTEKAREYLDHIEATVGRIMSQIDDLQTRYRYQPNAGIVDDGAPRVNLSMLVSHVVYEHQQSRETRKISLRSGDGDIHGSWESSQLERVMENLLSNAIKYSPDGREIEVSLQVEEGSFGQAAVLAVHDWGIGIPPGDLPRIFERHYRGTNVGEIAGSGIGLAGVTEILTGYGGTLTVDSNEDRGTTFTLRLPLNRGS